jgi:dTDP-4-amino-4,6-dideoxygalactose transaminase
MSMFSFHATKLFHTLEGGMLSFRDAGLTRKLNYLKNFGFKNETEVVMPGTNSKMNEIQALMGLQMLPLVDGFIAKRKRITELYRERLAGLPGVFFPRLPPPEVRHNYAYAPVLFDEAEFGVGRDRVYTDLESFNVLTRRYFYPLVCDFACYKAVAVEGSLATARRVASQVLCLPIYADLSLDDVNRICDMVLFSRESARR